MEAIEVITKLNEVYKNSNCLIESEEARANKLENFMQQKIILSNQDLYNLINNKQPATKLNNQPQVIDIKEFKEIYFINLLAKYFKVKEFDKLQQIAKELTNSKSIYFAV